MSKLDYKEFYRRNLPHIQPNDAIIFITYRLKFELPIEIKQKLQDKHKLLRDSFSTSSKEKRLENEMKIFKMQFDSFDDFLGLFGDSPKWLMKNEIAEIIIESLQYLNHKMFKLYSFCIMTNHVHILIKPLKKEGDTLYSLSEIMKLHKGFTANQINEIIGEKGQFWHHENYDHYIRNEIEFNNIIWYILRNPVKAGLCREYQDWKYNWVCNELKEEFEM